MDAYGGMMIPHYHPSAFFVRPDNDPWEHDQLFRSEHANRMPVAPMQRYLLSTEHSSFTPRWPEDDSWIQYPHPTLETSPSSYVVSEPTPFAWPGPQRCVSPSNSGPSSSYMSSSYSDRQSTPLSSPTPSISCYSPDLTRRDTYLFPFGGHIDSHDDDCDLSRPCVAMHDVQKYADAQPETDAFDDDQGVYYASYVQEGYQPMQMDAEEQEEHPHIDTAVANGDSHSADSPNLRRRRPQVKRAVTSPRPASKVEKRSNHKKRSSSSSSKNSDKCNGHNHANSRAFPCPFIPYGCTSTFVSKNEWKRHINTQHMRLGFWRCDLCDQADRKPNDFNRKDLFVQHIRRMHPLETTSKSTTTKSHKSDPEEQYLAAAAQRCWRSIRASPHESACLFCDAKFNGAGTWDERLEHIGRHMENSKKDSNGMIDPEEWQKDEAMEEWLTREKIITPTKNGYALVEGVRA